jgi:HEAT repeat protein
LLRRFLGSEHEDLHVVTFHIIQRIGPPAIPLLVELLRHEWVSIRRGAISELIDLVPHIETIQPALRRALQDEDSTVAGDAARALGALGTRASLSVGALVNTLSHEDPYVRVYAAEALASIGPSAASATNVLAGALGDPIPGVRWAACEALASIGPAAQSAVPQLIEALEDEFLYVRIFAAGALGSIGPKAQSAREALRAAADDPALRDEAEWALSRIAGSKSGAPVASHVAPAPSDAPPPQTTVVQTGNPPLGRMTTGRSIVWSVGWETETLVIPWLLGCIMSAPITPDAGHATGRRRRCFGISSEGWRIPLAGRDSASQRVCEFCCLRRHTPCGRNRLYYVTAVPARTSTGFP